MLCQGHWLLLLRTVGAIEVAGTDKRAQSIRDLELVVISDELLKDPSLKMYAITKFMYVACYYIVLTKVTDHRFCARRRKCTYDMHIFAVHDVCVNRCIYSVMSVFVGKDSKYVCAIIQRSLQLCCASELFCWQLISTKSHKNGFSCKEQNDFWFLRWPENGYYFIMFS